MSEPIKSVRAGARAKNGGRSIEPQNSRPSVGGRGVKAPRGQAVPIDSVVEGYPRGNTLSSLHKTYAPLAYNMPWEILEYVEMLSTYNADYSQAVDNMRTLANSGHELFVDAGTKGGTKKLKTYLEEKARLIQQQHGGIDGLIDKLLDQAAVYGAMCGEWILNDELTEVVDFFDINPKTIRYLWLPNESRFAPYQKVSQKQWEEAKSHGQETAPGGCVRLNELTFQYFAFDAAPSSPYGTPPFIAALEHIGIQRDMVANMSQIVKKLGLLGIIDLAVKELPMLPGETNDAYTTRANAYLDSYVSAAEDMVRDGGLVHFEDVEVKTTNLAGNAAGATNIFKQNEEMVFSGLKSMPSVQGRSYSTTETYAGVAYDIIIRNTKKYQRACKRMIESGYWLMATMAGFNPKSIGLSFHENKTLHRMQDAQAKSLEIKNGAYLWAAGVIDQQIFAQELGYSDIVTPMDEVPPEVIGVSGNLNTGDNEDNGNESMDDTGGGKADNRNNNDD